ncbi:hypothetical protein ACVJBD_003457 [Rhizobium mongolense]
MASSQAIGVPMTYRLVGRHHARTIPYNDKRIGQSPDGKFHQCAKGANFELGDHTLCLFVPNQGA